MKTRMARLAVSTFVGTSLCSAALAQEGTQEAAQATRFIVGAKAWHAAWLSYLPSFYSGIGPNGQGVLGDSVDAVEGTKKTTVMPQLAISHYPYFVSLSHGRFSSGFSVATSPLVLPSGQTRIGPRTDEIKRRESDLNLGYSITPEVTLSLGYKHGTETRDASFGAPGQRTPLIKNRAHALLFGASANFLVKDKLRFYAQAAYGPARMKADLYDRGVSLKTNGRYLIGEVGLSYPLYASARGTNATAAIGFRTQTVKTDSFAGVFQQERKLRDVRDGVVLSLNVTL